MAYQVDKFNGAFLVSIEDGTIDTTTDIRLVGKNYAGYGEVQNENFLHLLENFANTSPPSKAISGQIWYDSNAKKIKFYDGTRFKTASGAEVSLAAPTGLAAGDFWFDEASRQLYTWAGTEFVLIGPESAPAFGTSSAVGQVVQSDSGDPFSIIKLVVGDDSIALVSRSEFTLGSSNPIAGFNRVRKGITLINTQLLTDGITSTDHFFWGTASNSAKLGGLPAATYLRKDSLVFEEAPVFKDAGYILGDDQDLKVRVETQDPLGIDVDRDEDQLVFYQSAEDQPITFRVQLNRIEARNVLKIRNTGMFPGIDGTTALGSADFRWNAVQSINFFGNLTGNVIGNLVGNVTGNVDANDNSLAFDANSKTFFGTLGAPAQRSLVYGDLIGDVTGSSSSAQSLGIYTPSLVAASETVAIRDALSRITATEFIGVAAQSNLTKIDDDSIYRAATTTHVSGTPTVVARTAAGTINAVIFDGVATSARYADLAEKYLADADYEIGTVMMVGGEREVTASEWGKRAIGAVSKDPAYLMNKDLFGGTIVALKGRVPIKVIGKIHKGDELIASNNGYAVAGIPHSSGVFAIALESSDNTDVKLIEAIVL